MTSSRNYKTLLLSVFLLQLLSACGGNSSEPATIMPLPAQNVAPTASAGDDQLVDEGATVELSAFNSSDSHGSIASYEWSQVSGPTTSLINSTNSAANFIAPQVDQNDAVVIQLLITDDDGLTATDTLTVNIEDVPQNVQGPNSDEFNTALNFETSTSNTWTVHLFDGTSRADQMNANIAKSDWLVIEPMIPDPGINMGWFQDVYSAFLYQNVTNNFVVATKLRVVSRNDPQVQPASANFNAGGFVVRDPNGSHNGNENWVMYNMGGQVSDTAGNTYAREIKKTVNSISNMFLTDQDNIEEHMLVCRIDDQFYFYYWDEAIPDWREETFYNAALLNGNTLSTRIANGTAITPEIANNLPTIGQTAPISFSFDAANNFFMPETVQVGVIAHNWTNAGDTRAEFDYVRFAANAPQSKADCLTEFEDLGSQ